MNDFSVADFQDEFQEELEVDFFDSRKVSESKNGDSDERFDSVLNFMQIILEKSYGMFDKMMDVLENFHHARNW